MLAQQPSAGAAQTPIYYRSYSRVRIVDDTFYLIFNAHHDRLEFALPEAKWGRRWVKVLDTHAAAKQVLSDDDSAPPIARRAEDRVNRLEHDSRFQVEPRTLLLFRRDDRKLPRS